MSTHAPEHAMSGAGQAHVPPVHMPPAGHVTEQPPQLRVSLLVLTQPVGPHATVGGAHDVPHFETAASTQMPPQNT